MVDQPHLYFKVLANSLNDGLAIDRIEFINRDIAISLSR